MGVVLAWPDLMLHVLVGVMATALVFTALFSHGASPLADAWHAGRAADVPPERRRRHFNRLTGLVVVVPLLGALVVLLAYFGWWLVEIGWISPPLIALTTVAAWLLGRATSRAHTTQTR